MEEKGVKVIVAIIICVILFIAGIIIFLLHKKFYKEDRVEESTTKEQITTLLCNKWSNDDYKKYQELILSYNHGELYKLTVKYQYTFKYSYDKQKVRNDLKSIITKEQKKFTQGYTSSYESTKEGGNVSMTYDLSETNVRLYVNSEYFHNNMYLKTNELSAYLVNTGYNCTENSTSS